MDKIPQPTSISSIQKGYSIEEDIQNEVQDDGEMTKPKIKKVTKKFHKKLNKNVTETIAPKRFEMEYDKYDPLDISLLSLN
ncbi:hypothetical protein ENUP19_0248G0103 [Entamoeba nuttalli]|uniref:Uncharacterized protein n=2 Tax=Entamoeba nuttalli TaxID=412467 RepID=K2GRK0_ENTNP|nr:hypothetical protein ENU1_192880 [Entamoeba nuttalli P19]EKE37573.1 hypothetical protein ENU1_192880 [Entamoeba nuttalli P19]|eukprot:XP_008860099.1 hypothetical protein ENU1_192880 [Entamoeba nuttalli P19]